MRLTHIKLAGFKSFVDPTTLSLASNLTSVVGPNGCGKSNVIDAVRWVTGESSARQLRGEALEDVIFNGSNARKPVGRASVELKFDNSEGKLGGQYGAYAEISVRRELTRDGASKYSINNTRARRRDVVDLFLGTGLGGRSNYAVIEQGAVNRLVEAKPEEMRQVLEEAAGISKYKERRRETENRIRHTRENLDRLNDLIGEISQRLATLKRQAANAEKYKTLKADERRLRAELLALRWQAEQSRVEAAETQLRAVEDELRAAISTRRQATTARDAAAAQQSEANDTLQQQQGAFYDAQATVGRLEQARRHAREVADMRQRERQSLVDRLEALGQRRDADRERDTALADEQARREAAHAAAAAELANAGERRDRAETAAAEAERAWDALNNQSHNPVQQLEAEKTRAEYAEAEHTKLAARRARRQEEHAALPAIAHEQLDAEAAAIAEREAGLDRDREAAEQDTVRHAELQQDADTLETRLGETRTQLAERQAELAAERTLQQAVLREDDETIAAWLAASGHGAPEGIARRVVIAPEWAEAARAALNDLLSGFAVARLSATAPDWPDERLALIEQDATPTVESVAPPPGGLESLADGIEGPAAIRAAAASVFVAPDWAAAMAARGELAAHQRIVTLDGACLGPGHLITPPRAGNEQSVFEREQRITALGEDVAGLEATLADNQTGVEQTRTALAALAEARQTRDARMGETRRAIETARAELEGKRLRAEQTEARRRELAGELTDLGEQLDAVARTAETARARVAELKTDAANHTASRDQTRQRLTDTRRTRDEARRAAVTAEKQAGELEAEGARLSTQRDSLATRLAETQQQFDEVSAAITQFDGQAPVEDHPAEYSEDDLAAARERQASAERELRAARDRLKQAEAELGQTGQALMQAEQGIETTRERLGQAKIDVETAATRRQGVVEQLAELGQAPAPIVAELADDADVATWQAEIERHEQRIARLGAINLAAIEEYDEAAERERYLNAQHADLSEALETLEAAIARIDRETRQRFRSTYEQIDTRFSEMFPQLFGGGEAALSLTEEDWLTTGVRVMARPPGKRNASIQMLSGGEKALTAVALLFALFELNPAPFCMLDEIDAPLDDANVARFCELVRTMSARVQFIVITHNKLTMELAEQLHGVTMAEPGVSRLVSVDIDAALDLAG